MKNLNKIIKCHSNSNEQFSNTENTFNAKAKPCIRSNSKILCHFDLNRNKLSIFQKDYYRSDVRNRLTVKKHGGLYDL
jgi:hypothetical protein